jgi:hypothetical protein
VLRGRVGPAIIFVLFICYFISHAYAHHDVVNMHTTDFASPFSTAALPDTDIMTLSPFPFPFFSTITPTAHLLPACTVYGLVSRYPPDHATSFASGRTDSVLSPNLVCPLFRSFPPLLALSRSPVAVQFDSLPPSLPHPALSGRSSAFGETKDALLMCMCWK